MRNRFLSLIILNCFLLTIYSQEKCNNYKVAVTNCAVIGSTIDLIVNSYEEFQIITPVIVGFNYLSIDSFSTLYTTKGEMYNGNPYEKTRHYTKKVKLKCNKVGDCVISPILLKFNDYSCYTSTQKIKIFPPNDKSIHKIDSISMRPYVDSIQEIENGVDFFITADVNKNKIKLGDSILVTFSSFNSLSNGLNVNAINISDSIEMKDAGKKNTGFNGLIRIDGRNYDSWTYPSYYLFFKKSGTYNLSNVIFKGIVVIGKGRRGDKIEDFFNKEYNETRIPVKSKTINVSE